MAAAVTRALPPRNPSNVTRATDKVQLSAKLGAGTKGRAAHFSGKKTSSIRTSTPSPPPEDDDFDLTETAPPKPGVDEIKKKMYTRECTRLGVTPVGIFLRAPTRAELHIRHYGLGPAGARALSVPLMLDSTLTTLDLESNGLGFEGLSNLREMLLDHCSITHLNLRRNNLGNRGALVICQVLQTNRLIRSVNLSANSFDDKTGIFFANMLKANSQLTSLDLSDNQLAEVSGRQLGQALSQNETLETLDLCWNHFSGNGAVKLLEGMKENVSLKKLSLAYNCFGVGRGSKTISPTFLSDVLTSNTGVESLDLSNNRLSDIDILMVARGLKVNEAIKALKVGRNLCSVVAARALISSVMSKDTSALDVLDMEGLPISQADLTEVEQLRSQGVKVIHGNVHQSETDFESKPLPNRHKQGEEEDGQDGQDGEGGDNEFPSTEERKESQADDQPTAIATYVSTTEKPVEAEED